MANLAERVIYLDFDGVLHPVGIQRHYQTGVVSCDDGGELFRWMPMLEQLLYGHKVNIVLSTSWVTAFGFEASLARLSPPIARRVIGATWEEGRNTISKSFFVRQFRHEQIVADVARRGLDADQWLAIDDEWETIAFHLKDQFAACLPTKGISDPDIQNRVSTWLQR
jgi:hypothetical protein